MDRTAPTVSIVIPLYRDEGSLGAIFDRCGALMDTIDGGAELVLVDDGGGIDAATARANELAGAYRHPTRVVRLTRNFGQHAAVFAGLAAARGHTVVTLDSDLQYPPEEIPKLLAHVGSDIPVVSGSRSERNDPLLRRWITHGITRWLNRQTGAQLTDFGSMFRAYDRSAVELMLQFTERHRYVPAVVAWLGLPVKEVPVEHHARGEQGSRYRLGALLEMMFDLVTGYSVFPLRVVTAVGLVASLLAFLASVAFAIYRVAVGQGVSGTVSAFALVFALLAVQITLIAMVGEYVGRVYTEAKGRPYYLVRDVFEQGREIPIGQGHHVPEHDPAVG